MGVIKVEDIVGYFVGEQYVCCDCMDKKEEAEATQDEILVRSEVENGDKLYFCDRCEEQIQ